MEPIWSELEEDLRRFFRRVVVEALIYPLVIVLAGSVGAGVLLSWYPGTVSPGLILRDLWWGVAVTAVVGLPLWERYRRFRVHQNWYRAFARVTHHLHNGSGVVVSVECASREGGTEAEEVDSALRSVVAECTAGTAPAEAFSQRGCPGELCRCLERATSGTTLEALLQTAFSARAQQLRRYTVPTERLAPAAAIGIAGIILLWIVVRAVLPVLEMLYSGGLHA